MNNSRYSYYSVAENRFCVEEEVHTGYGVCCRTDAEERVIGDISQDRKSVEALVEKLNKMDAGSVHLDDIIEDFLP